MDDVMRQNIRQNRDVLLQELSNTFGHKDLNKVGNVALSSWLLAIDNICNFLLKNAPETMDMTEIITHFKSVLRVLFIIAPEQKEFYDRWLAFFQKEFKPISVTAYKDSLRGFLDEFTKSKGGIKK